MTPAPLPEHQLALTKPITVVDLMTEQDRTDA